MKKGVVLIALGLLSWTMAGSAFAGPFGRFQHSAGHPQQQRAIPRTAPTAQDNEENREKDRERMDRGERIDKNGGEGQRNGESPRNAAGQGGAQQVPQMPGGHAGARMSLEERQKLRRQINEASRSLYTPPGQTGNK
jgi:hypothetical protein